MRASRRNLVRRRARGCCEYCGLPEAYAPFASFHVEHITARQHRGSDALSNLALACHQCNLYKGPNLTGVDPETGRIVRLFQPRRHKWAWHFRWEGAYLVGRTAVGRTTITVLDINDSDAVKTRLALAEDGILPFGKRRR